MRGNSVLGRSATWTVIPSSSCVLVSTSPSVLRMGEPLFVQWEVTPEAHMGMHEHISVYGR